MSRDPKSPTNRYRPQGTSLPAQNSTGEASKYAPVPAARTAVSFLTVEDLTLEVANTPQALEFIRFLASNDPRPLAEALVSGRLDHLQYRRDVVNFCRRFIGLPPRPMHSEKLITDVMDKLTALYALATGLLKQRNAFSDQAIEHAGKQGQLLLATSQQRTQLLQERIKQTQLERELQDLESRPNPDVPLLETRQQVRTRERDEELRDAEHAAALAFQREQEAKHKETERSHRTRRSAPRVAGEKAATPPPTAAERRLMLLKAEELKVQAVNKAEQRSRKELDDLKQEYGVDSEEYRDREAYWNGQIIKLKEREAIQFLGKEDQERLGYG